MSLVPFGFGDGGGGPTREMIARGRRAASLEGSPTVEFGSPAEFFRQAEDDYPDAPTWVGEMYLELHRGTYTSQARTKRGNRRGEHLLREAELWATTATVRSAVDYPYDQLRQQWETLLLQQFHDILPGSSIAWVYRDAELRYDELAAALEKIIADRLATLAGAGEEEITFNAAPHDRDGVAALGATVAGGGRSASGVRIGTVDGGFVLDNGLLRVTIDHRGLITSLVHVAADRDAIAPGAAANLLQLHRDMPNEWDAWDVDEHYRRSRVDLDVVESMTTVDDTADGVCVPDRAPARSVDLPAGHLTRPRRRHRRMRHHRRLARTADPAQARLPVGRRGDQVGGGNPVRARLSSHPRPTLPGSRRNSRSALTAGSTSANRASAWPSPTTESTGTT